MWTSSYWAGRYWAARYWAEHGAPATIGFYWASRYWTRTYWTPRYWNQFGDPNPFSLSVSAGPTGTGSGTFSSTSISQTAAFTLQVMQPLTGTGTGGISASLQPTFGGEFDLAAPLLVTGTGSGAISCSLNISSVASSGTGFYWSGSYWSSSYWMPRYWQTQAQFNIIVTQGIASTGSGVISAVLGKDQVFSTGSVLAGTGSGQITASIVLGTATQGASNGADGAKGPRKKRLRYYTDDERNVNFETDAEEEPTADPGIPALEVDAAAAEEEEAAMRAAEQLLLSDE